MHQSSPLMPNSGLGLCSGVEQVVQDGRGDVRSWRIDGDLEEGVLDSVSEPLELVEVITHDIGSAQRPDEQRAG